MGLFSRKTSKKNYTDDDRNETLAIIENNFGKCVKIIHEIVSENLHIDIAVIAPSDDLDFYKLFTIGMASKEMNIPSSYKRQNLERAELAMFISKDNILDIDNIVRHWAVQCLKTIAYMPFQYDTWVGEEHTIDLSNLDSYNGLSSALLLSLQSGKRAIVLDSKKHINFYLTVPLFPEELAYETENGFDSLLDLFDNKGVTPVVDFSRKNCCI